MPFASRLVSLPRVTLLATLAAGALTVAAHGQDAVAISNPGFEDGLKSWQPSKDDAAAGLSQVSPEAAHTGTSGLRVKQETVGVGSWVQSARAQLGTSKGYRLDFWARCLQDSGIGVWVNFYDAQGKPIPGGPAVQIPMNARDWKQYHLDLPAPDGASYITLAVHAYSNHTCLADLDDFAVVPAVLTAKPPVTNTATPAQKPGGVKLTPPDVARVKEIAANLNAVPAGIGFTLDNRAPWETLKAAPELQAALIPRAEKFLQEPIPQFTEAQYQAAVAAGSRDLGPTIDRRRFRLTTFVLSEGVENKGRFLPAIEAEVAAICSEGSWIIPAHVKFTGKNDLGSAMTAWTLGTTYSMLGDRLSPATRKLIKDAVLDRVVHPYLEQVRDADATPDFWRYSNFNWNAVVHAGITGAALAVDDAVQERAEIVAASEKETALYIQGFPADGYSTEGMGYWKYGFGHYIMLAESVAAATHNKVNLYNKDSIRLVAQFPRRFELVPNVYPAYSDATFMEEPPAWENYILDRRYGLGDNAPRTVAVGGMYSALLYAWGINLSFDPSKIPVTTAGPAIVPGHRLRDWFDVSQVYVGRPPATVPGLSLSFKGGNNGTSHGHNDLGSYTIVAGTASGTQPVAGDPGGVVYNAATFGALRYQNQILNSYGHAVPRVAGQLQVEGEKHLATVTASHFTDAADSVTLDLTKGYEVPALRSLLRTFDYSRNGETAVAVTDKAEFASPQAFGTAIVSYGDATEEKPGVWLITFKGHSVRATIDAGGLEFTVTNELLKDAAAAGKVHRLGIELNAPAASATITVKLTPAG